MASAIRVGMVMPAGIPFLPQPVSDAYWGDVARRVPVSRITAVQLNSLLANAFNKLLCAAHHYFDSPSIAPEHRITHLAMLHADCQPESRWVDTLFEEMESRQATVVASVIAIKAGNGMTSTAVGSPDDPWDRERKGLSFVDIWTERSPALPETFGIEDLQRSGLAKDGQCLLVNTGCMLIDLRWPAWREVDGDGIYRLSFRTEDRIVRDEDGRPIAQVESEDWNLSRRLHALGARVFATKKVGIIHHGMFAWPNDNRWLTVARQKAEAAKTQTHT